MHFFFHPELQGFDGQRDFLEIFLDIGEIRALVLRDLSVPGDLDEPVGQRVNGSFFFIRSMTAKTTLRAWARTVATAAPAASI